MQVYGDPLEHPQTESYWGNVNPIGERSCYDEGKRVAETLAFDYQREHGIEVRCSCIRLSRILWRLAWNCLRLGFDCLHSNRASNTAVPLQLETQLKPW